MLWQLIRRNRTEPARPCTYEENEGEKSSVVHFTTEAGTESDLELTPVDNLAKELDITVEGETVRVSMVDTAVLQAE